MCKRDAPLYQQHGYSRKSSAYTQPRGLYGECYYSKHFEILDESSPSAFGIMSSLDFSLCGQCELVCWSRFFAEGFRGEISSNPVIWGNCRGFQMSKMAWKTFWVRYHYHSLSNPNCTLNIMSRSDPHGPQPSGTTTNTLRIKPVAN